MYSISNTQPCFYTSVHLKSRCTTEYIHIHREKNTSDGQFEAAESKKQFILDWMDLFLCYDNVHIIYSRTSALL